MYIIMCTQHIIYYRIRELADSWIQRKRNVLFSFLQYINFKLRTRTSTGTTSIARPSCYKCRRHVRAQQYNIYLRRNHRVVRHCQSRGAVAEKCRRGANFARYNIIMFYGLRGDRSAGRGISCAAAVLSRGNFEM